MAHHDSRTGITLALISAMLLVSGCSSQQTDGAINRDSLVGAWRSKIAFKSGPFAAVKDLEFLHAYNVGGTMTESSNYDEAANSSPPAYGVWKLIGERKYQTKYVFFTTKAPDSTNGAPNAGDWWPAGHGELTERIHLSEDGRTYTSSIKLDTFDNAGKLMPGSGEGTGAAERINF
ncbi:MAG: hypothetical protein ABIU54_11750 [Candidatus Eisenbacteria bacterium]